MITSAMPLKATLSIVLLAIGLIAYVHGKIDKDLLIMITGPAIAFLNGLLTHTKVPDEKWEETKKAESSSSPPVGDQKQP